MATILGDSYLGIGRPNWATTPGVESLTSNMDFITIYTGVDIRPNTVANTTTPTTATSVANQPYQITVGSATGITLGMWAFGANIVGTPVVVGISGTTITLSVAQSNLSAATVAFAPGYNLDKLIELVALRGQPVIMGSVAGSGPYSLIMATEHLGWSALETPLNGSVNVVSTTGSASGTAITVPSSTGIVAGMQIFGAGVPTSSIPTVASITDSTHVAASTSLTITSGTPVTFSKAPVSGGPRLIDRIYTDGISFGFQADYAAGTLGVVFSSVLT